MTGLSTSLLRTPQLDRWISLQEADVIQVWTGKVEIGQGISTALVQIVARELHVSPERIRLQPVITGQSPNEMVTAGSMSVEDSGGALRAVCIHVRNLLLANAARELNQPIEALQIDDGIVSAPDSGRSISWWELQGEAPFNQSIPEDFVLPLWNWPQNSQLARVDLPGKLRGEAVYVHDFQDTDVVHARIIRPGGIAWRLEEGQEFRTDVPGGQVVRDGSFLAVLAPSEIDVERAAAGLGRSVRWTRVKALDEPADLSLYLREHVEASYPVVDGTALDAPVEPMDWPRGVEPVTANYSRPYLMHGSIAGSAAAARWDGSMLRVWTSSQGIEPLRLTLASVLELDPNAITVQFAAGPGCYGHNGADDVALDAALCARARPGETVLVKWSRAQEAAFEPCGPAMHLQLEATLSRDGEITAWQHQVWSFTHVTRPSPVDAGSNLLAAWSLETPMERPPARPRLLNEVGIHRNASPIYEFPAQKITKHFVPDSPLRTSALRGLGAHANVFAIESFMDELAVLAEADPFEFRLRHLRHKRAAAVLETLRDQVDGHTGPNEGFGIGLAQYKNRQTIAAVAALVRVSDAGDVRVLRLWIVADCGVAVDPDGVMNQLEGGAIQSVSWTLKEAVTFDADGITSTDWESYPILRFEEVPEVSTHLVESDNPPLGAGEATQGPTAAAVANAVFAATGLRVRDLPLTPEQLRSVAAR